MTADETGSLPLFFVADGVYRVRLVDQFGVQVYDFLQIPSIGASSSGGGGSAVDPTTVFQTGDPIWLPIAGTRAGFVRMNGRTIGSATSGSSERANADCQPLFLYLWANYTDALCPVSSGRGMSAAADWAANKRIGTIDMRGKGPFGLDDMGNVAAGILTLANLGVDPTVPALAIGEEKHLLGATEMPTHNHGVTDGGHVHLQDATTFYNIGGGIGVANVGGTPLAAPGGRSTQSAATGIAIQNTGGGANHNNTPPGRLGTWFQKL